MGTVSQASLNMKAFVIVSAGFGQDDVAFLDILMMTVIMISTIIIITIIIFIIIMIMIMTNPIQVALVAAVAGEADPYTIGQVLAGQTNGGVITSTTYHGGVKVPGFPYTTVAAAVPHTYGYPYAEADPALVYSYGAVAHPYALGAHAVTYAGAPHAVAYTPFGVTHSSNVGICTNVEGAQVPCRRKREAEADPAVVYGAAMPYGAYGVLPYAGVHGTNPVHAVAYTGAGLTHSSNV